jgi:hypothetical protein
LTLDRLAYNIGVMTKSPAAQRALSSLSRHMYLHKLSVTINVHDMQRVCLTKPVARAEDASVSLPAGELLATGGRLPPSPRGQVGG